MNQIMQMTQTDLINVHYHLQTGYFTLGVFHFFSGEVCERIFWEVGIFFRPPPKFPKKISSPPKIIKKYFVPPQIFQK